MIKIIPSLIVCFALVSGTSATEAPSGDKAQTSRMSQCSADAKEKGLKGDDRKDYMSRCLRSSEMPAATKQCNAEASEKRLTGDKRNDFLKSCVKSRGAGAVS
jgi:hypothetical protein